MPASLPAWGNDQRFREALTASAALRDEYAALKVALAAKFGGDRRE